MKAQEIKEKALATIRLEANAVRGLGKYIDDQFPKIINLLAKSEGRIVVTGIGKSANIANKIVSTFNSTGTPALFMHAADAIHGDLGMVQKLDTVLCISKSGNSPEIRVLVPLVKKMGNVLLAMTGDKNSYLAEHSDFQLISTVKKEACPNNLAPTTSTTAQLVMGDVLAVCLMEKKGFSTSDFAKVHPGGSLGKKIYTRVSDIVDQNRRPFINSNADWSEVIMSISKGRMGATAVIEKNKVIGIVTDGDLRRAMQKKVSANQLVAKDLMSKNPKCIDNSQLAVKGFQMMEKNKINQLIVLDGKQYSGMIHIHDLLKEGIY
ncbi:MAG: KpsF/GutQ family sugar-phosphate isomerase [Bacteroidota bacterium]